MRRFLPLGLVGFLIFDTLIAISIRTPAELGLVGFLIFDTLAVTGCPLMSYWGL